MSEHTRFEPRSDRDYQEKLKEIQYHEEQLEVQRGKLKSLPNCDDVNCLGRTDMAMDKIRKTKNSDNREKEFISPQKRKIARNSQAPKSTKSIIETKNAYEILD
ncbi:hypothetical protein AVEN_255804-1 [Araneus ventricosus]|uniref:Uncharacterized protein n=1 Tax=Araneus ventricosus TaxID=182803 RepID=A0A4Y2LXI1_ARAVE|nr:hypothetical protein AVEN_255804-1 [Araneus ventricosus]